MDLLLVEELKCSLHFVRWLAAEVSSQTGVTIDVQSADVTHSKRRTHNRREIDISLDVAGKDGRLTSVLIENKLDTSEQFQQAESYKAEAELLVSSGVAASALTVLVCPQAYSVENETFASKFDAVVSYEAISTHLYGRGGELGELGARLRHRAGLLDQAVTKSRRGYEAVPLQAIEQFNAKYVELARQTYPALKPGNSMLKEGRPGESKTMIFASECVPDWSFLPQTRLVHQLREGNANVNFYGWGDYFTALAGAIGADLEGTPYRVVPTINKRANGKSGLMIVADTPTIDNLSSFDSQKDNILHGMKITEDLRIWLWSKEKQIHRWAEIVAERVRKAT